MLTLLVGFVADAGVAMQPCIKNLLRCLDSMQLASRINSCPSEQEPMRMQLLHTCRDSTRSMFVADRVLVQENLLKILKDAE
jgi:hypothetical protein